MRAVLAKHPYVAAFLALAVAFEGALYVTSRNVLLQPSQYATIAIATFLLAAICVWVLTWE